MKLTMAACRLLMALFLLSAWQCSFAQKIDKYGYKVVKEMRVVSIGYWGESTRYIRLTYDNNFDLKEMKCSTTTDDKDVMSWDAYKNGELLTDKYVRSGNKIHRYRYVGGDLTWKYDYCDYWLNSDGVVEKKEEWSCDADGSGGAIRNTDEFVYRNESFTKLPLIYKISEIREAREYANSRWVDSNEGDMRIWEYDYTCGYMNYRQCMWFNNGKFFVDRWQRNGYILYDGYPNMDSEFLNDKDGGTHVYVYSDKVNDTNVDFYDGSNFDDIFKTEWCSRRSNNLLRYNKIFNGEFKKKYEYTYDEQGNIVRVDVFSKFAADGKPKFIQRIYLEYLY